MRSQVTCTDGLSLQWVPERMKSAALIAVEAWDGVQPRVQLGNIYGMFDGLFVCSSLSFLILFHFGSAHCSESEENCISLIIAITYSRLYTYIHTVLP